MRKSFRNDERFLAALRDRRLRRRIAALLLQGEAALEGVAAEETRAVLQELFRAAEAKPQP